MVYVFLNKTKKGFEISVIGKGENTAKYAGINIKMTMVQAIVISGIVCGISGVVQASGVSETLSGRSIWRCRYTAIIIAC